MSEKFPKEGDVVLCTVERITPTAVFVKLDDFEEKEGSISLPEIAPGRIRNLRDYVIPKKKIVCLVLRVEPENNRIELSLRRVSAKEKEEIIKAYEQEKSNHALLKSIFGEKTLEIEKKIKSQFKNLSSFFSEIQKNPELASIIPEKEKLIKAINEKKEKKTVIKKQICLKSLAPDGIVKIKSILNSVIDNNFEVVTLSPPNYLLISSDISPKEAQKKIDFAIKKIESEAKKFNIDYECKK